MGGLGRGARIFKQNGRKLIVDIKRQTGREQTGRQGRWNVVR
jgi:hypothetical protein